MRDPEAVRFQLAAPTEWAPALREEMFQVLDRNFEGVTREQFGKDLAGKSLVMLLRRGDRLTGFSTLAAQTLCWEGEPLNVIYSGDTIVEPDAWGSMALPRAWVAGVNALTATLQPGRCFWLLLTSGFRTYRFLPLFWREFYPRFDRPTPPDTRTLMRLLARERFGTQYCPATGLVRFCAPQRLRRRLAEVPPGRTRNPHVAYFLKRNPRYSDGDELVCLTEICSANLTAAGRRMMPSVSHELDGQPR